ncbi:MAG: hypothetical protein IKP88_14720 [Lachnospiraceae bacterium]|nr:hypothetical protein [Lachnospiraceae bacterium]
MTVLSATMSMRRLQMVARLHRVSLNHSCQTLEAGEAIDISDSKINVLYDENVFYLNSQGKLGLQLPTTKMIDEYITRLENHLPAAKGANINMVLTSDGANASSWQPAGEYYRTITEAEISALFNRS